MDDEAIKGVQVEFENKNIQRIYKITTFQNCEMQ